MILENKNVLITGAGGFIGSHLVEELVNTAGCNVKAFIHYNSRNYWGLVETLPEPIKDNIEIGIRSFKDGLFIYIEPVSYENEKLVSEYKEKIEKLTEDFHYY